jgi:hypothetical protein
MGVGINVCEYRADARRDQPRRSIKAMAAAGAFSFAPLMK